jgi:hypothetical protein
MKKLILIALLTLATAANGAVVNIFDVQISPAGPSDLDIITIEIDGSFSPFTPQRLGEGAKREKTAKNVLDSSILTVQKMGY